MKIIPKTEKLTVKDAEKLIEFLNKEYFKLHKKYEDLFWVSYMGDHSVDEKFTKAKKELDEFKANTQLSERVNVFIKIVPVKLKERFLLWKRFFSVYQTPKDLLELKDRIIKLESKMKKDQSEFPYGYKDSKTGKFIPASNGKLRLMVGIEDEESIRKAAYDSLQESAPAFVDDYLKYVSLMNEFAKKLGFEDFYAYKVFVEEGMTKKELFEIFDKIFDKTKSAFVEVAKIAEGNPKMKKPWNFSYMISADFEKEEDPYFQFDTALDVWTKTFANLGVDFRGSKIKLDLLDRKGKYSNGFCHWPEIIRFDGNKRLTGQANFTCNLVPGTIGAGEDGIHTLFHEGGHAAHYLNSDTRDVCVNHEYPPSSTAWAETQSMFMDTIFSSIEWKTKYAKNKDGKNYPFDLFQRKLEKLHAFSPLRMMGIMSVMYFEKEIYETKNLTKEKVIKIAKSIRNRFSAFKHNSVMLLNVPHIYSWESACSYHGYGLAELALSQWREYFFKKYGYIVDNKKVGKEMLKVWKLASSKTFPEFVKMATGKKLSSDSFIRSATKSKKEVIKIAKERIEKQKTIKTKNNNDIGAKIELVHGKEKIADNSKGFDLMVKKYNTWLKKQK
ncbi:MAG: M3 family metallopeptidase [Candidatus Paceibacterota bacterium]